MKVKATGEFKRLGVNPEELNFIPEEGKEFEVSEARYQVLTKKNKYNVVFVEEVIETAKKEIKSEKAVKRTSKKAK